MMLGFATPRDRVALILQPERAGRAGCHDPLTRADGLSRLADWRYRRGQQGPERRPSRMIQAKRYAVQSAMVLSLSACLAAPGSDMAWLEGLDDGAGTDTRPCYETETVPAVIETVTEQVLAADGSVAEPDAQKSRSRQAIVRERQVLRIETPCPAVMTPEFIATLQRALAARGLYAGEATGIFDAETRAAVERYQTAQGVPSGVLSVATARELGLIAYPREEILADG
ncbi:MAG: peptidoglycan-binding domain-containing protein [Paracoccaceae bacterium]